MDILITSYNVCYTKLLRKGLYPYTRFYLRQIKERFDNYWSNHFSTIGIIGANEAALNLLGVDIGTEEGRLFGLEVLSHIRDVLKRFQQETGNYYNLEATPAEGTGFRLAQLDKARFHDMKTAQGLKALETPVYTNSTQLPVDYCNDVFEVIRITSYNVCYTKLLRNGKETTH